MLDWWARQREKRRMKKEAERPSAAHRREAESLLERAKRMDEADLRAATDVIERNFIVTFLRLLSRLNKDVALRLLTGFYALKDPAVPFAAKAGFAAVLLYFLNPFDLVPDLSPVIGLLDDAGVLAGAWMYLSSFVTEEHRHMAEAYLDAALSREA